MKFYCDRGPYSEGLFNIISLAAITCVFLQNLRGWTGPSLVLSRPFVHRPLRYAEMVFFTVLCVAVSRLFLLSWFSVSLSVFCVLVCAFVWVRLSGYYPLLGLHMQRICLPRTAFLFIRFAVSFICLPFAFIVVIIVIFVFSMSLSVCMYVRMDVYA